MTELENKFLGKFALILLFFVSIICCSCGAFLQNSGMKNYSPKNIIKKRHNYNDYQYDFVYMASLVDEGFPKIDSIFPSQQRNALKEHIIKELSQKNTTNKDFVRLSRRYLSHLKNQHTTIHLPTLPEKIYPYYVHISYDKWYITNISKRQDSIFIGKQIDNINEIPISVIEQKLRDFTFAENKTCQQYDLRSYSLHNKPSYLQAIGVIKNPLDKINITFSDSSSVILSASDTFEKYKWYKVKYPSFRITQPKDKTYWYQLYPEQGFGYLQYNKCHDKIDIQESIETYLKPWVLPMARWYVRRQFKKKKPSKRLAPYYNSQYPTLSGLMWELVDSLNHHNINNLIIDLRNNRGGNPALGIQMMYFLTEEDSHKGFKEYIYSTTLSKSYFKDIFEELEKDYPDGIPENELVLCENGEELFADITDSTSAYYIPANRPIYKGKVYVLANSKTASAAAMLATLLQDNKLGITIGTSVGNNPTGPTTYTPMKLPKTKAEISIATYYQFRPDRGKGNIQIPDYWVEYTLEDLHSSTDPYLEKAKELMASESK